LIEKWQRTVVYTIVTVFACLAFAYFWFTVFQCGVPNSDFWLKGLLGQCVSSASILGLGYSHGIISALTDFILVGVSVPMIKDAKLLFKEKLIVIGIICLAVM